MTPSTRQELVDYCLRALGAPVIEINVDEDQLEDRVDEALQYYQSYHSDAIIRTYAKHQVTADDVTNEYIPVSSQLAYISRVLPFTEENSSVNMFDARYQIHLNDIFDLGHMGNLHNYVQIQQYMSMLDMMLNGSEQTRYNRHMNRLYIDTEWDKDIKEGDYVIIDGYQIVDPASFSDVYNDMWLKKYLVALIKRQWGLNLIKFEGMQLPGGVVLNGRQIFDDANNEIQQLEEEIRMNWEMPVDMFVG